LVPSDEDARPQTDFLEHDDNETWRSVWQALEKQPLNLGEISFRFAVIKSAAGAFTDVIVVAHHAFTDGKSVSNLAHELLVAMTMTMDKNSQQHDTTKKQ
jgi:hypothetical protein